jgi:hypothetical protein
MVKTRRSCIPLLAVLVVLVAGVTRADAFVRTEGDPCPTYDSCSLSGPEWEGGLQNPTPTMCNAFRSRNQACRDCQDAYYDNGQPKGYQVCAYVKERASCQCSFSSGRCSTDGSCTYVY